jgi:hypothetical protein
MHARPRRSTWAPAALCAAICCTWGAAARGGDAVEALIRRAGSADDEAERLKLLRQLWQHGDADAALKAEAGRLAAAVERWITSRQLAYFGREIGRRRDFDFGVAKGSPLWPLTCIYRGRMLVWLTLESGGIQGDEKLRRRFLDEAAANFRTAAEAFPNNRIVRMYLGEPIPWPRALPGADRAPQWAALLRENLERLADIVEWWIDHRMQPDGQYGGGWGDDCEMWRWWTPVLIGFDSPKIARAQARFSDALMGQPHMAGGYTSRMSDVEHTAEDSADVITPMMHLAPDDPAWKRRALRLAELMEKLWTARNERGGLQFRSTYFTADRVDGTPQRACDSVYHPRAVQPALLYWQRTGDEKLGRLFAAWMDTWVDAAARAERGKPAGVLPSAIHFPDGRAGGLGRDWWDPRNHGEAGLYRWPSAMSMMCDTLLLTWHMTGDEKYLQPLRSMAAIRLKHLKRRPEAAPSSGSEAWCAAQLGFLAATLAKHKRLSGSEEFDELLARDYRAVMAAGGDERSVLAAALRSGAEALRINFQGYTSEVRYTDRVLRFPRLFGAGWMFPQAVGGIASPRPDLLYSAVTGDPGQAGYFPLNAVRWLTPPRDIAALVTEAGAESLTAELYHFGGQSRSMAAELYLLKPGRYAFQLVAAEDAAAHAPAASFTVKGPRTRISFELPPRKPCRLHVRRAR